MTQNAFDTTYTFGIYDDSDELSYNIWEANRLLTIAKSRKDKKMIAEMKKWLKELGYSLEDSTAEMTFTV